MEMNERKIGVLKKIIEDLYEINPNGTFLETLLSSYTDKVYIGEHKDAKTHTIGLDEDGVLISIENTALREIFSAVNEIMKN